MEPLVKINGVWRQLTAYLATPPEYLGLTPSEKRDILYMELEESEEETRRDSYRIT